MKSSYSFKTFVINFLNSVGVLSFYMGIAEDKKEADLRSRTDSGR